MCLRRNILLASLLALGSVSGAYAAAASDPQSVAILTQALNVSGAANLLNPIRDFTASGTITYFWAGEPVRGPATIRARGHEQFRLDADLPEGRRSVTVNRRSGARKEPNGRVTRIPYHNTTNLVILTFPHLAIAVALTDPSVTISYVGLGESGGRPTHQIRVSRTFPEQSDPDGVLAQLSRTDYFVDAQTYWVTKTAALTHPLETLTEDYPHEIELESYTVMSGVAVPTVVREKVGGQTTWELRLSSITFNTNLTDTDFSIPD